MASKLDLPSLVEGLQELPTAYLVAGAVALMAVTALVLRVFTNTFTGKAPPWCVINW